ncbi:MAG: Gfo/Idh/MocA family oxidoreductase [Bacteroidota bacterium]
MKARICIIGNGSFANKVHYPSLFSFGDVEVVGIFAFNEQRLLETARRYNIPGQSVYTLSSRTGYRQILSALRPDGVYVIGPPEQMIDVWTWCLENKLNLFIEKPLGITLHQAEMFAWLAKENGCITQVSFQRRSSPILNKMKEMCLEKGPVTHAVVEFSKYEIAPMLGSRDRMLDDYIHCIDTARWLCGGEIIKIDPHCRRILVPDINWIGSVFYFDNGAVCHVIGNWSSGRRIFRVNMHAPGICVDAEPEKEAWVYEDGDYEGKRYDSKVMAGSDELFVYGGFQKKSREFIDSILSGIETTSSPFSDALKTMQASSYILARSITV